MTNKQIIHNYMMNVELKSKKKVKVTCKTAAQGKEVYNAINTEYPAYMQQLKDTDKGANYKDFTLQFKAEWAASELAGILQGIKSNSSYKVQSTPSQTQTSAISQPAQATQQTTPQTQTTTGRILSGSGTVTETSGIDKKKIIIIAAVFIALIVALVLWKRK